jgi:putative ABC transport system permease protein
MDVDSLRHDIRDACRALWRDRAFSAAAILTLGTGLAGAAVMTALIQGVLLRPLPVQAQDRLLVAWRELRSSGYSHYPFGDAEIDALGEASQLLERVAGVTANGVGRWVVADDTGADYVNGALVTGGFFDVLGVRPLLGRTLVSSDDVEGAERAIVISSALWQRRFGGSPDVIGRRVTLSRLPFTIVGVIPPDIDFPRGVELWRTTRSLPTNDRFGDAARREVDLIARRRAGVTLEQAAAEIAALSRRLEAVAPPNLPRGLLTPVVRSFDQVVLGGVRRVLIALLVAVGMVLLIACANAANLMLMRGESRRAELAVREALGAGRIRIVRQLLIESAALTLVATALGVLVSWWSLEWLTTIVPDGLPRVESVRIDGAVVLTMAGVAFCASLLAGLAPSILSARVDLVSQLRGGARALAGTGSRRGRRALVVAQVALAVTVVAAAGLLARSVLRLQSVDPGVAADRLLFASLEMPDLKYAGRERHTRFLDDLVESLERVPGIAAATPVNVLPFSHGWSVPRFAADGQSHERAAANPALDLEAVHPDYFETLGVPIVRGRGFTPADREGALDVAVVSEEVAARTWPGQNPIGKRLKMGAPDSRDRWRTVVGVAAPTRYRDLARPNPATLYLPAAQFIVAAETIAIRTTAPLERVASIVRDRVKSIDPDVQVMRVAPFNEMLARPLARPRFNALLLGIFGAAALLLAAIGHYAVIAAYVRQRDREIALRVALGATTGRVGRLVLGEAMWLAGAGAAIGLACAAGATRLVGSLIFDIDTLDPMSLGGAALILVAASALASCPAIRRAVRLDAVALLRN